MRDLIVTPFRVGVVVIGGLAAFLYMMGQVREGIGDDAAGYRVYAIFNDVSGLVEKSRVVIAGISVGQIEGIELAGARAKVWLLVNTPLKSDATVAKRQASLLGEYYLQLTPGALGDPLREGDQIKQVFYDVPPSEILNESKDIVADIKQITRSLREVISGQEGEERLRDILDNINVTISQINRTIGANAPKIDVVVDNIVRTTDNARLFSAEFRRDARVVLDDVQTIASEVRSIVGRSSGDVQEGFEGVKGAVTRLQGALDKLDGTLDRTRSIATKIDQGQGSIGRLVNDPHLIDSVTELVDESNQFVRRIVRLQTIVALRSEYYLDQNAFKNYLQLRLQPKPDKYYLFEIVSDPRGRQSFKETVTASNDPASAPVVHEQQTTTSDAFRFSLQFAKRFYFMTGRIGIIESSGGVGVDVHLFDDSLELSGNLFDFSANLNPRLKLWASYTFFTHLYVAAGIDDIMNAGSRDYFGALGLSFNDDDLKALLTAAPSVNL